MQIFLTLVIKMSKGNRSPKGEKALRWLSEQSAFPTNLRRLMEKNGVTQQQLADVIGVTRQTISQYAGGQTVPDIYTVQLIADFFNIRVANLLCEDELGTFARSMDFYEACTAYAGLEMYKLFFNILSLTDAGRDKVAERVEELKEVRRYYVPLEEQFENARKATVNNPSDE